LSDEQRSEPGCAARELCRESLFQDSSRTRIAVKEEAVMNLKWTAITAIALLMFAGPAVGMAQGQVCDGPINPAVPNPTGVQAIVIGTTVTISWNLQPGTTALLCVWRTSGGLLFEGLLGAVNGVSGTVPPGDYAFRVYGVNAAGQSVFLTQYFTVGGGPVIGTPGAPATLSFTRNGLQVALNWSAPSSGGPVSDYLVEAGSAPGTSNLAIVSTPGLTLSATAPPGIYYVRVRGRNPAGIGPASPEIVIDLSGGVTPPSGPWRPCSAVVPSIISAVPVPIQFVNVSSQPRLLYWIDFAGIRQPYGLLLPGQSGLITSFITHSWIVTDLAGTCLATVVISGGGRLDIP
jgi:hypothetical protein